MGFFRKDAEQPSPIADESGSSSPTHKLGDEKVEEVVLPTREVDEAEEQRLIRKLDRRIVPMMVSFPVTMLRSICSSNSTCADSACDDRYGCI